LLTKFIGLGLSDIKNKKAPSETSPPRSN